MHRLLLRQLKKLGLDEEFISEQREFLERISLAYEESDRELRLVEHSLFVVSSELNEKNRQLRNQISDLNETKVQRDKANAELSATLDATADAILAFNDDGGLSNCNGLGRKLVESFSLPVSCEQQSLARLFEFSNEYDSIKRKISRAPSSVLEGVVQFKHAKFFRYYTAPQTIKGESVGRIWCFRDITSQRITEDLIRFQALHDSLTGLPNRTAMRAKLDEALQLHRERGEQCAVIFLEFSGVKHVSDTLGHEEGDRVLIEALFRLYNTLDRKGYLARFDGEAFIVILSQVQSAQRVEDFCRELVRAVSLPVKMGQYVHRIRCTLGFALYPADGEQSSDLVKNAELARYFALNERQSVVRFSPEIAERELEKIEIEREIHRAVQQEEFVLYLQPKVDIASGGIVGCEGLVRWQKDSGKLVPPNQFIPIAEKAGFITLISRQAIKQAVRYLAAWREKGIHHLTVSINLSILDFNDDDLVSYILGLLHQYQVEPERFVIEITESLFMENKDRVMRAMQVLNRHGVSFALDDFGTGYSSLSYLQQLPFSYLKIDRSFLMGVIGDAKKIAILKTIVDVGRNLGLKLVAEGIEDLETLDLVREKTDNDALAQGFYFHKPMPEPNFLALVGQDDQAADVECADREQGRS